MDIALKLALRREAFERLALKHAIVTGKVVEYLWIQHHEPGVDWRGIRRRFFSECSHRVVFADVERTLLLLGYDCRERGNLAVGFVERQQIFDVDIANAVSVCHHERLVSNIKEVVARGAVVIALANEGDTNIEAVADHVIELPEWEELTMPSLAIIPLQLFAYYVASLKGCDIDKPRNLAKSVTVE